MEFLVLIIIIAVAFVAFAPAQLTRTVLAGGWVLFIAFTVLSVGWALLR